MERLEFNDYEDFACAVADTYDALDYDEEDVAIIAKYEEARQIIKELLCLGYDIHSVEIHDELWENYDAEYVISLYENEVWCEPMIRDNGKYIDDESSVIYVLDNCSSEVLKHLDSDCIFEVGIGDECDECEEGFTVNGKPVSKEEFDNYTSQFKHDEKPTTTTASKESYFINGKSVDKSEFDKKYEEFEEMYMDNISNIMLDYCNLMDNVNDWRNRILSW